MKTREKRERGAVSLLQSRRISYVRGLTDDLVEFFESSKNGEGDVVLRGLEGLLAEAEAHQTGDSRSSTGARAVRRRVPKKPRSNPAGAKLVTINRDVARPLLRKKGITAKTMHLGTGLSEASINNIIAGKTKLNLAKDRHHALAAILNDADYPANRLQPNPVQKKRRKKAKA